MNGKTLTFSKVAFTQHAVHVQKQHALSVFVGNQVVAVLHA